MFPSNVMRIWGETGREWLESLPVLVELLAQKWDLVDLVPVKNMTYNYVVTGLRRHDNVAIVLKLSCDERLISQETQALNFYGGRGCVKLLDVDMAHRALLLECAVPGNSLRSFFFHADQKAVSFAADVMHRLHAKSLASTSEFPMLANWLTILQEPSLRSRPIIPEYYLKKAQDLSSNLVRTAEHMVLLHGDLHHDNILSHGQDYWVAIDPKGVIGDPAYEVGPFICNPMPEILNQRDAAAIVSERVKQFSRLLALPEQRLKQWTFVHAVLAACWTVQDGDNPSRWLAIAQIIDNV